MKEAAKRSARPERGATQAAVSRGDVATTPSGRTPNEDHVPQAPPAASYHVRIDGFEGPFDLLLQLIARRKLDVSEVDLAEITGDFLAHLGRQSGGTFDLDTITHFLIVAATLVELKAARLLPATDDEQLDELLVEARDVLYARLLEYRAFRGISGLMADLLEGNEAYVGREVPLEPPFRDVVPRTRLSVDAADLAALAAAVLAPKVRPRVSVDHIRHSRLTIKRAAARILARLRRPGQRASFSVLVGGRSRSEQVVHFIALLELFKIGYVDLHQRDCSAPLDVERCGGDLDPSVLERLGLGASSRDYPMGSSEAAGIGANAHEGASVRRSTG